MTSKEYRQAAYALILKENKILLVQKKSNGMWDFPGGGVDEGESIEQAVSREILEELGTSKVELVHTGKTTNRYDWSEKEIEKYFTKTGLRKQGQEQNFVILNFIGTDDDIHIQEEELSSYKWVLLSELSQNMSYPDQFEIVQKVLAEQNIAKNKKPFFVHFVGEIECTAEECNSSDWITSKVTSLLESLNIQVLETVSHHFEPLGISQVYILSASHLAVHTWPENGYIHLDIVCCKEDIDLKKLTNAIDATFKDFEHSVTELKY